MRREVLEALKSIKDKQLMANMINNMNMDDAVVLMSLLEFADNETQTRWLTTYSNALRLT